MSVYKKLLEKMDDLPVIDVHSHVDLTHLSARGLHDVLLYHMVVSELYSAGCPDGKRLSEWPSEEESRMRIMNAIPYLKHIRYTSTFFYVKKILKDLYNFEEELTEENWERADRIIRERFSDRTADSILNKSKVMKINTEYCRKNGIEKKDYFYSLEWAFFTRSQYQRYDTPVLELEIASSQKEPKGPLPVNINPEEYAGIPRIKDVDGIDEAVLNYVAKIPFSEIVTLPTHFSTDIQYQWATKEQMQKALLNRTAAGTYERDIYANYINQKYFECLSLRGEKTAVSISLGAEPLRYETGSRLEPQTLFALEELANRYPDIDIILYNGCKHMDVTLCTIIRETPNLYAAGFWWHNFFPSSIQSIVASRIEMLPLNKWFGCFSDAYCVDWVYAKIEMIKKAYAAVLAKKIEQQMLNFEDAVFIANQLLYENARVYFKLG